MFLNRSAFEILDFYKKIRSIPSIAKRLSERYGIDLRTAENDVRAVLKTLRDKGFIGRTAKPSPRTPVLRSLDLHITERCNLSCPHCYYGASPSRTVDLPAAKAIGLIAEGMRLGAASVSIGGGEPLLHPEIKPILRAAAGTMSARLLTNGILIDKAWAAFLARLGVHVQVSLDGPDAATHDAIRGRGSFGRTMRAIKLLQKAGLGDRLALSTTIMDANLARLDDMIALAGKNRLPLIRFLPVRRAGRAARNWPRLAAGNRGADHEKFYDAVTRPDDRRDPGLEISCGLSGFVPFSQDTAAGDDFWCPVGTKIVVAADGNAYPCTLMMNKTFLLGNVHREHLEGILGSTAMTKVCRTLAERSTAIPKCASCPWNNFCQAGCMGLALDRSGRVMATDRFCAYRKKAYRTAAREILKAASRGDAADAPT